MPLDVCLLDAFA
ncbi:hypothetical protein ABUU69_003485 [Vibrio cholerae]